MLNLSDMIPLVGGGGGDERGFKNPLQYFGKTEDAVNLISEGNLGVPVLLQL